MAILDVLLCVFEHPVPAARTTKKGPEGPLSEHIRERGRSDHQARRRAGRDKAEEQQERGSEAVEMALEGRERHEHTFGFVVEIPGGAGPSVGTSYV